jgi:predicted Zn-dependent protease
VEFRPRLPDEGVNVSRRHPLNEALVLVAGVLTVAALLVVLGFVAVELLVPRIPPHWEVRVFSSLQPGPDESLDARVAQQRAVLQSLLDRLASRWPDPPYPFRVWILEETALNALAFPGGAIGVTSGLLLEVESENELAFVLGHELGHFRHRHHLRGLGRALVVSLVLSAITGSGVSSAELLRVAPMLAERRFAREQEREADRFGLELLYREYGHVAGGGDFFRRVAGRSPPRAIERTLTSYLSTHPGSADRIQALQALAREQGWPRTGETRPFTE